MMKTALLLWVLLLAGLFGGSAAHAQGCVSQTDAGAKFDVYDAATGQLITKFLCVGRPIRLRDRSGKNLDPAQIYYRTGSTVICNGFTDTTTTFTPTAPGALVITQNTQGGAGGNTQGIIFAKPYEVLATPVPTFELSVCSPGLVQVTITDTSYPEYFVQVGSTPRVLAPRGVAVSYITGSGPNTVTITGRNAQAGLCEGISTKPFTPLPTPKRPVVRRLTLPATGTVQLEFEALQPEYRYQLQLADATAPGGYRTLAPVTAASPLTLPAAPLPGCYRLLLQDQCQPAVFSLPSNEICSVQLTGAATNGSNQLSWTSAGSGIYTLTRTEGSTSVVLPLPAGATTYPDAAVSCGTTYRYQVSLISGPATSVSNEISLTALSTTPPARPRLWAGFNLRNQVELRAEVPGLASGGRLSYQRNGAPLAATPARRLLDSLVTPDPAAPLCYAVEFQDECGNRAPAGASVCVVQLVAEAASPNGPEIRLTWSALTATGPDPAGAVSYQVQRLAADNRVISSVAVGGTALTYLDFQPDPDRQTVRYRIEARGAGLTEPSYSNVAEVARPVKLVLPTAFTPNGDGLNDVLELKGRFLDNFRFTIIDRNGQTVFQTTDRTRSWDGRIKGAAPVPGAYAWQFEALDQRGQRVRQYGNITILR